MADVLDAILGSSSVRDLAFDLAWVERPEGYAGKYRKWVNTEDVDDVRYQMVRPGAAGQDEGERAHDEAAQAVRALAAGQPVTVKQAEAAVSALSRLSPEQVATLRHKVGLHMDPATARRVGEIGQKALDQSRQTQEEGPAGPGRKEPEPEKPTHVRRVIQAMEADHQSRDLVARLAEAVTVAGDDALYQKQVAVEKGMDDVLAQMNSVPDGFDWKSRAGRILSATIERAIQKAEAGLAEVEQAKKDRARAVRQILAVPRAARVKASVKVKEGLPEARRQVADNALNFLRGILAVPEVEVAFDYLPGGRCHYTDGTVQIDEKCEEDVVLHEMGHLLEDRFPGIGAAVQAYLEHRCGDELFVSMRDATGSTFYGEDEYGRKDDFEKAFGPKMSYYVGKTYEDGGTELLAMALQWLYKYPGVLAKKDPELCAFLIGVLHGRIRLDEESQKETPDA